MPAVNRSRILIIATDGFEDSELLEPRERLLNAGADVTLASLDTSEIKGAKGATITPERQIRDVDVDVFDGLLLPGGTKNPDRLRMEEEVVALIRTFVESGKPVGAICHAPWLLVEADVVRDRTVTGWPSIRTDLRNAGAKVVDQAAVTDQNIVTSRKPEDIPVFIDAFTRLVEKAPALAETA
jgi:protease I